MRVSRSRRKPLTADQDASPEVTAPPRHARADPPDAPPAGRIGELLLERGLVDSDTLRAALTRQSTNGTSGKRVGALLLELGAIDEQTLLTVLSEQLGVPTVDLRDVIPEEAAIALLAEPIARTHHAIPLRIDGDTLDLAIADPTDTARTALTAATGKTVRLFLAPDSDITRQLNSAYRVLGEVDRFVKAFESEESQRGPVSIEASATRDDAPVVQVVLMLLTQALRDRASDVHIEPQDGRVRVRFRIDGALHEALELPADIGPALASRLKIMATLNIVERRRPQDGQFSLEIDGRTVDMRLSVLATIWGEKCVIRLLDSNRSAHHMHELGMPESTFKTFNQLIHAPFGMVLCAGPTGSGKTTTLYASLAELNQTDRNITTVEDPVEYVFDGINQISVNDQAGVSFATGLKSILRQDPDVILVGEIRDVETARIAVQSALTGHFVLSTLHGTDAVAALHRLLDMGIESFLIASSVVAVVGQRLVRRICEVCIEPYQPTADEMTFYLESGGPPKETFLHGVGCHFCAGTGYQDRVGVYELLQVTPEMKRLIVGWATQEELRRLAQSQGMRTLREEAVSLVAQDVTTINEVIRSIYAL